MHLMRQLDPYMHNEYIIVYIHTTLSPENEPPFAWLRKVYDLFDRRLKENLYLMYIVHASWWLKMGAPPPALVTLALAPPALVTPALAPPALVTPALAPPVLVTPVLAPPALVTPALAPPALVTPPPSLACAAPRAPPNPDARAAPFGQP